MRELPFDQLMGFYHVNDLEATRQFYSEVLELPMVLDQGQCLVFKVIENGYVGFCERSAPELKEGTMLTFVVDDVDGWYQKLSELEVKLEGEPFDNDIYGIYHFFFRDPDGYMLEIQRFHTPLA